MNNTKSTSTTGSRVRRIASGLVVMGLAVAAFAYWTGDGTGEGQADVGTSSSVVLTATVPDGIAPGTEKQVSFKAANSSGSDVYVTKVKLDGVEADSAHEGCETSDFSMAAVDENHRVPAGATAEALPEAGTLVYADTEVNQDACKNAELTLSLTAE
jgi:hypothetical protein